MKKGLKLFYGTSIFSTICLIIMGLFLFFKSESTIEMISYILGGFIIALGIAAFIRYFRYKEEDRTFRFDIVYGIISSLAGIILICNPHALASIIPLILGIWITISSALKIQMALQLKSYGHSTWIGTLVIGCLALLCGIILIFNPFKGAVIITKVIGIFLIIYAILDLVSGFMVNRVVKKHEESNEIVLIKKKKK